MYAQIVMFIGFLEYIISQIVAKPGYIPGDYVGANDLFSDEGPHSQWDTYQVCCGVVWIARGAWCAAASALLFCCCRLQQLQWLCDVPPTTVLLCAVRDLRCQTHPAPIKACCCD